MSKRKMFIASLILGIFLLCGICAYGYFIKTINSDSHNISSNLTESEEVIKNVSTASEFYEAIRYYDVDKNDEFNSNSSVTNISKRKVIKLTNSITLSADTLITADCHIDLNTFSIDLHGYDLVFKHLYDGTFAVYNGTITDSSVGVSDEEGNVIQEAQYGKIIIDCPNACVDITAVYADKIKLNVIEANDELVVKNAMKFVLANIQNGAINDFYTTSDVFDDHGMTICTFDHEDSDDLLCIYTHTDLDLIYNYFTYEDLVISYSVPEETTAMSNTGNILEEGSNTVELTITISYGDYTLPKVVNVHILSTEEDYANASNSILLQYLAKYYDGKEYVFNRSILLPKGNTYLGTTYTYSATGEGISYTYDEENPFNDVFDGSKMLDYVVTTFNSSTTTFTISTNEISTDSLSISANTGTTMNDNYAYALTIVSTEFDGSQVFVTDNYVKDDTTGENINVYTNKALLVDGVGKGYTRLNGNITYELKNNDEGTYKIENIDEDYDNLCVDLTSDTMPYLSQNVSLEAKFSFKNDGDGDGKLDEISIPIPIIYKPSGEGEGFDLFAPYYVYFNKEFGKTTNNFTIKSFDIPVSFEGAYPTYSFIIYDEDGNFINDSFNSGHSGDNPNKLFEIAMSGNDSYNSFTKESLNNIIINPYYIDRNNKSYYFAYIPLYKEVNGNVVKYYYQPEGPKIYVTDQDIASKLVSIGKSIEPHTYEYTSILTIPGIVRYNNTYEDETFNNEAFADQELYHIAYELLYGKDTDSDGDIDEGIFEANETFILTSALTQYIEVMDFANNGDNIDKRYNGVKEDSLLEKYEYTLELGEAANGDEIIGSLKGINELVGLDKLLFRGTDLVTGNTTDITFVTELAYVSQITNLSVLDLCNTGIYDQRDAGSGFPEGEDNGFLEDLSNLANLKRLYLNNLVDEENNKTQEVNNLIYSFSALSNFSSLEYVDVTGNTIDMPTNANFIDQLTYGIANGLYGSNGSTNNPVFSMLEANGTTVIGKGTTSEQSPESKAIIYALSSLEYQDRLSKKVPMQNIMNNYISNISGLSGTYTEEDVTFSNLRIILSCYALPNTLPATNTVVSESPDSNGEYIEDSFTLYIVYDWKSKAQFVGGSSSGTVKYQYTYKVTRY